jgi:hypothetical protein
MSVVKPRGRKPAAVYWRRRIVVLAVAAGLVLAVTRWVGGDDAAAGGSGPTVNSAVETSSESPSPSPTPKRKHRAKNRQATKDKQQAKQQVTTTLREPQGVCEPGEVVVVPDVVDSVASRPVPLRLGFSTTADRGCTLELSGKDLALEVTSGDDLIWQLSSCPGAFDRQELVLRPGWVGYTQVTWNGRRGDDTCADTNEYAKPGYYWAEAAVLGGEPARGQFKLEEPPPPPKKKKSKVDQDGAEEKDQDGGDRQQDGGDQQQNREDEKRDDETAESQPDDQT